MRCASCDRENAETDLFCVHCGALLPIDTSGDSGQPDQPVSPDTDSPSSEEIQRVWRVLDQLSSRISALETSRGARVAPALPPSRPYAAAPVPQTHSMEAGIRPNELSAPAAPAAEPSTAPPEDIAPPEPSFSVDWERILGMNWLAIVGAVALTIGMGFFLKLAFDNNWITETGRVLLGIAVGAALLGAGEYTARRYPLWASAVTGSGIGVLYLAIYAAFAFYELVAAVPALVLLGLVVGGSDLLALRYESRVIGLLSIFGAFLTPVLLVRELADPRLLLAYIILVDLGILAVSVLRNWRWYNLLGLLGSYMLVALWLTLLRPDDLIAAQFGLTVIFLIFVGATTLFHIVWRQVPRQLDMTLMTLNAMLFYGNTFGLLWDQYESWFGLITLTLSGFYGLIGLAVIRRAGAPRETALFSFATALVFLTIAVPLQLTGSWITVAWAAEGAVLVWAGFFLENWRARAFALLVFAGAAFRLLIFDTPIDTEGFQVLLNTRFPTFAVSIAAIYVGAYLHWRGRDRREERERFMVEALAGAANLLTIWALSAEVITYFDASAPASAQSPMDAESGIALALTALWSVYAGGLLAISLATGSRLVRLAGLAMLALPVLALFAIDSTLDTIAPRSFRLVLNYHFLTASMVLAVSIFAAYLLYRQRHALLMRELVFFPILVAVANVVALWMLTDDVIRYFGSRELVLGTDQSNHLLLSLTVLWAIYGVGVIGVGIVRQSRTVRQAGLALLAIPVVKLFAFDVFLLERGYRATAFVTLGVLLLGAGFAYHRYSDRIRRFVFGTA